MKENSRVFMIEDTPGSFDFFNSTNYCFEDSLYFSSQYLQR